MRGWLHDPATLPQVPTELKARRATEGWYGCSGEKKNLIPLPKIKPWFLCHFAHSTVSYSTQLSLPPLTLPNTQHSKRLLSESRKVPLFKEPEGSFCVHQHCSWSPPQVTIIHSTSYLPKRSLTINFMGLSTFIHLSTLPCMLPNFPIKASMIL
jgi:hypothetical protein